jgi:hypothetical protein
MEKLLFNDPDDMQKILARAKRANGSKHDTECNRYLLAIAVQNFPIPEQVCSSIMETYRPKLEVPSTYHHVVEEKLEASSSIALKEFVEQHALTGFKKDGLVKRRFFTLLGHATNELCSLAVLTQGEHQEMNEIIHWVLKNAPLFTCLTHGLSMTAKQVQTLVYFCTHCVLASCCYGLRPWQNTGLTCQDFSLLATCLTKWIPHMQTYELLEPLLETLLVLRLAQVEIDPTVVGTCARWLEQGPPWRTRAKELMSSWHVVAILIQAVYLPLPI